MMVSDGRLKISRVNFDSRFGVMLNILPLLVVFLDCLFTLSEAVPLSNKKLSFDFEDNWDHEVEPHESPLLDKSSGDHILPVSYEYEQDLRVLELNKVKEETRESKKIGDVVRTVLSCGVCKIGVGLLEKEIKNGSSFEDIRRKFVSLCVSFQIETEPVCTGFFNVYGPEVIPAYEAADLGPSEVCKLIFGETCEDDGKASHEWDVGIPGSSRSSEAGVANMAQTKLPSLKILHLSDVHYDPEYAVGFPANCEEPLCCRSYSTPPRTEAVVPAGRWGAYNKCDSPKRLLENMLKNIAVQHPDIDYIIWTGDLVPHDIWNQTKESNLDIIEETIRQMSAYFPNTPIFPTIGNHESVPAGNFAPPWMRDDKHSINWLYSTLADQWKKWLPVSTRKTVLHGGFYSVLLRPGFRLISVNTNYCHSLSWWLLVNSTDPAKQLKWLTYELQNAENKREKVQLIGHIPPGSADCLKTWSKNFYLIVDRYRDTIVAQFYGHSHADEFEIFYETKEYNKPINIAYLGPSVTTYENYNPAYRIYYVDGDHEVTTREVLDHETWTMNLQKANEGNNEPVWYRLYSAKDAYEMTSLKPSEWNRLVQRMTFNDDLFDLFYRNYYRDSSSRPTCDSQCKIQILCDLKSARSQDRRHLCQDLMYVEK